jgi:protein-S-isoprenylcysteine O-methyltransferase Ste14
MNRFILFGILSIPVIILSRRTLFDLKSHGLYRFLSWECIIWLLASNYRYWFTDAFSLQQIISWIFLVASGYLVIAGATLLTKKGKPGNRERENSTLYGFEQTSELVDSGIFRYIRHPLYSSLLFLTWGIFLKSPTLFLLFISALSTLFLILTALFDEKECVRVFGDAYREYMRRSKRFVPFLF